MRMFAALTMMLCCGFCAAPLTEADGGPVLKPVIEEVTQDCNKNVPPDCDVPAKPEPVVLPDTAEVQ